MRTLISLVVVALAFTVSPGGVWAQGGAEQTRTTPHYRIVLEIGPVATMLMPEQAVGAKEGEVMVHMPGMPMAMGMTDQGRPVNHHLEVHIYDKGTGGVVANVVPKIALTNHATGKSRPLPSVAAMYDVKEGQKDLHFGGNLFLSEGKYAVRVRLGNETAVFKDIAVTDRQ